MLEPKWIIGHDRWRRFFRTDTSTAFHGRRSFRLENADGSSPDLSLVLTSCNFGTRTGSTYTYSAYMKADRPGVRVKMFAAPLKKPFSGEGKEVTLTREWERYAYTYTRKNNSVYHDQLRVAVLNRGVAWIDAVQLENGTAATAFMPAGADQSLTVHEGNADKELFQVPVYKPRMLKAAPVMDGVLDDPVWRDLRPVSFRTLFNKDPREQTTARFYCTDQGIYIGVKADEKDADQIQCTRKGRDSYVWNDPSFEIFVDSKLSRGNYHHLAFNADGVQFDAENIDQVNWNSSWQVRTSRGSSSWSAEIFLPFSDFSIDQNNSGRWGFNLCRTNPRTKEYTSWAPTYGGFHSPLRFGQLEIDRKVQEQYFLGIRNPRIRYAGRNKGTLEAEIYNDTDQPRKIQVRCSIRNSGKTAFTRNISLPARSAENVVFGEIAGRQGEVFQISAEILSGDRRLHYCELEAASARLLTALVQYDYYTGEKELEIRGTADLTQDLLKKTALEIRIHRDRDLVYLHQSRLQDRKFLRKIPIGSWRNSSYRMTARLLKDGEEIADTECSFQKLPPSSQEIKLDRFRRITLVNGSPFFPLGFFWEGQLTPELVACLADSGVNFIHSYRPENFLQTPELFTVARNKGIMYEIDVQAKAGRAAENIRRLKNDSNILNWYTYDEAFTTVWGKNNYPLIIRTLEEAQKADPYRPAVLLENNYGLAHVLSRKLRFPGKIPTLDYYCYPPNITIQSVDNASRQIVNCGATDGRPAWIVLFATGYAFHASRDMTPAEHEYQAYISLINGVRGIAYWAGFPKSVTSFRKLTEIFKEIKTLQEPLLSLEDVPAVSSNSPHISLTVKKSRGQLYLITVNGSSSPVKGRLNLAAAGVSGPAEVLFENRSIPLTGSFIEDSWPGLGRHVYRLGTDRP